MVYVCCAANCEAVLHLTAFPTDPAQKQKWIEWVKQKKSEFEWKSTSRLCWRHFETSDFQNWHSYMNKHSNRFRCSLLLQICVLFIESESVSVFDAQSIHTCYIVSQIKIIMLSIIQTLLVSDVTLDIDTLVCVLACVCHGCQ